MRPSNKSRSRNKPGNNANHGGGNNNRPRNSMGNIINRVFESAGPDGKVRGTPQQIIDKYQALARDAQVAGDRVTAESYLQHSEHYSRMLGEAQRQQAENNRFNQEQREDGQRGEEGGFEQRRPPQQQPMAPATASGLTTIDSDDPYDMGGPIETPEGRRSPLDGPAPVVQIPQPQPQQFQPEPRAERQPEPQPEAPDAPQVNGGEPALAAEPEVAAEPAEAPVKRPRPRRRQKAEVAPAEAPVQQAE